MEDDYIRSMGCALTIIVVIILWAVIIWAVVGMVTR